MKKIIPSYKQCLAYIEMYEMLDNIRAHSYVVAKVAEVLLDSLMVSGRATPPLPAKKEVIAGALLHDIAKTLCIKTGCNHAETGQQICITLGYPQIGEIVAEHVILKDFTAERYARGFFTAKDIVFYADKRVRHDKVVSLQERLEYIIERYGDSDLVKEDHIRLNFQIAYQYELILFTFLDFEPSQLSQHILPKTSLTSSTIKECS